MQRRVTRASNSESRPALKVLPKPRCSSAQVQAEKQAKATLKEDAARQRAENMAKVAEHERDVRQKMKEADLNANKPKDKLDIPRARRIQEPVQATGIQGITEPVEEPIQPAEDSDAEMDLENDELDTGIKKNKAKKLKDGLVLRGQINAMGSLEITSASSQLTGQLFGVVEVATSSPAHQPTSQFKAL
ncbi:hypothetical protein H0H81_005789 [Sphagnurus paluster]|uniref:Uncharacterized protein n=1 Tax=Sphagnurus paluster TaxID=117069 RepID=A0A9P7GEL3_9AGAR|nr:hypothetical protein H0H81_005789 [Sphagnurus paluster]